MRGTASSRCVKLLAILALVLLIPGRSRSQDDDGEEPVKIARYLVNLSLGDTMEDIQRVYPPAGEWPMTVAGRLKVKRYRVERAATKYPAPHVETMWLGMRYGQLVEIELVYSSAHTHAKSVDALAQDLALSYGAPHSDGSKFWWVDRRTVLRVFYSEVPSKDGEGVELRTSLQLAEKKLFPKKG
jgi:hypothetical protein